MHILIAPDSFKGSLSALSVAENLAKGISQANRLAKIELHPMADGGEGSLDVLNSILDAEELKMFAKDAMFKSITAKYLRKGDTAFVEMAEASGLQHLRPSQRNPEFATSYGTGQLIKHAVKNGCKEVYLFVGGTATNDGAMGIAQALGYKFFDKSGQELLTIGESLQHLESIQRPESPLDFRLYVVSDVKNPLYGPNGAAYVYARQKGADEEMIERLDRGLRNFAAVIKRDLGVSVDELEGGGAAGGTPAGCKAFFGAQILPGIQTIIELTGLAEKVEKADLVISGEGMLDQQTFSGKVVQGVSQLVQEKGKRLWAVSGQSALQESEIQEMGIEKLFTLLEKAGSVERAMNEAAEVLLAIGEEIGEGLK
ncbi:glycerate kinase [Marinilongibacter aquaticus]|uniref:glycerate kinase n=1 Tax=Marinilongibacter aquaticus TaxID=2975157 RepID=UPI0021BD415D|nr:glycerate kinase [Marinilongibacter aquaticus]UBM60884.1 glycerate kinase [Marinilongibacter aquaticus]